MNCAYCGMRFEEKDGVPASCGGCSTVSRCDRLRCPRCGYPAYRDLKIVEAIRRWWRGAKARRRES